MYPFFRRMLLAGLLCLISCWGIAQGIEILDPVICRGVSVEANGSLYRLNDSYAIVSLKAEGSGTELKDRLLLTPDKTTRYIIEYSDPDGGLHEIEAVITVKEPPFIRVAADDPSLPLTDGVCAGTTIGFHVEENLYGDPVFWTISTSSETATGNAFSFEAEVSCKVTVQASNDYCPIADTAFRIEVVPRAEIKDFILDLSPTFSDSYCAGCTFFPDLKKVLKGVDGADSVCYSASSLEWEEGGTQEKIIAEGMNKWPVRIRYALEKTNRCGTERKEGDTVLVVSLDKGVSCQPSIIPAVLTVTPCTDATFRIQNNHYPVCVIQNPPAAGLSPATSDWVLSSPRRIVEESLKRSTYLWNIELQDYRGPIELPALQVAASYTQNCPYSKELPALERTVTGNIRLQLDTTSLTFRYEYCPKQKPTLTITGTKDQTFIREVVFKEPSGVSGRFVLLSSQDHERIYEGTDAISAANIAWYSPLAVEVTYLVYKESCQYEVVEERRLELVPRENCDMEFTLVQDGPCIAEERRLVYTSGDPTIRCESIVIEDIGVFEVSEKGFTSSTGGGSLAFIPYYAGAPGLASVSDSIRATVSYRIGEGGDLTTWTKSFKLTVKACKPELNAFYFPVDCKLCEHCPGTDIFIYVKFTNPTTDTSRSKVFYCPEPPSRIRTIYTARGIRRSPVWQYLSGLWNFRGMSYLFSESSLRLAATYNEGDSVYHIDEIPLLKEGVIQDTFSISPQCALVKEPERDSCCSGDRIKVFIYSNNPYDTLFDIQWAESCPGETFPVGSGLEEWDDGGEKRQRFHYEVVARSPGRYPFTVYSHVRDTILVYHDTLCLNVLTEARIFTEDTVYVCTGATIDLKEYVDSAVVSQIFSPASPEDFVLDNVIADRALYALARLKYQCGSGYLVEDSIHVVSDQQVYLSNKTSVSLCPGSAVRLQVATNGRVDWYRQDKLPGGAYSERDTLYTSLPSDAVRYDTIGTDTVLYTAVSRTACMSPSFLEVSFRVDAKSLPKIDIVNTSVCAPDSLRIRIDTLPGQIYRDSLRLFVNGYPAADWIYPAADSLSVSCRVVGLNGCVNIDSEVLYSYPLPQADIVPASDNDVLCFHEGHTQLFSVRGNGDDWYGWFLQGATDTLEQNDFRWTVDRDTLLFLKIRESKHGCTAYDSVFLRLYGKGTDVTDTLLCYDRDFSFRMPDQDGVWYQWYEPDGTFICPCPSVDFAPFELADTGLYTVLVFRGVCVDTQQIRFHTPPYPGMEFVQDGDFCEADAFDLEIRTDLPGPTMTESGFLWLSPAGDTLLQGIGAFRYSDGQVSMADTGLYRVRMEIYGCYRYDSLYVSVYEHLTPAVVLEDFYCEGDTVFLKAEGLGGSGGNFRWFQQGREWGTTEDSVYRLDGVGLSDAGLLYLEVRNGACLDTARAVLEVREMPEPDLVLQGGNGQGYEKYFCSGDWVRAEARGLLSTDSVFWIFEGGEFARNILSWTIDTLDLSDSGWYSCRAIREGCDAVDSILLQVRQVPEIRLSDTFFCEGKVLLLDASDPDYPDAAYYWESLGREGASVTIDREGSFPLRMEYEGCVSSTVLRVRRYPVPLISFPSDTVMCDGDSILLSGPRGMDRYLWQDSSSLPYLWVYEEGLYVLRVEDSVCDAEASVNVRTDFCAEIYFPSAFSPNGDGINDAFYPFTTAEDNEVDYQLRIFNRWGEQVFYSRSLREAWDGTLKGKACPPGVYVYRCVASSKKDGRDLSKKGTVALIR